MGYGLDINNFNNPNNNSNNICDDLSLNEGDRIQVLTVSGATAVGIFLRCINGFLIWIRCRNGVPIITITSLNGLNISKV